jgi:putative addiction module component (TIGR02574 family)
MTTEAAQVLSAALHLPHPARAFLAERLLESLDAEPDFPLSAEWVAEIKRRCEQIDRGEVGLIPGDRAFLQAFEALG